MAAITSNASGNWSATGTWVGGVVPVNGDTVTIATGHTVTVDVYHSDASFATGIGLTLAGTGKLQASTTAGSYRLKVSSTTVAFNSTTSQLIAGSVGTEYPIACDFEITLTNATSHSLALAGNSNLQLYCAVPANAYAVTTSAAAINATTLPIDRNLTTDKWRIGDLVDVCNINKGQQVAELIIASIGASSITFTTGVPFAALSGAYVVLARRNVRVVGLKANTNQRGITGTPTAAGNVARAEWRNLNFVAYDTDFINFDNALLVANTSVIGKTIGSSGRSISINNATAVNNSNALASYFYGFNLQNCLIAGCGIALAGHDGKFVSGQIIGCTTVANGPQRIRIHNSQIVGNGLGFLYCTGLSITNSQFNRNGEVVAYGNGTIHSSTFANSTYDIYSLDKSNITAIDCTSPLTMLLQTAYAAIPTANYIREINTTANTDVATGRAGTITKVTDITPTGYSAAYRYTQADIQQPMYFDTPVRVENLTMRYDVWLRQSAALGTPLTVSLFRVGYDPHDGYTADVSVSLTSGAVTTWEKKTIDATLTAGDYIMRVEFSHSSANASAWVAWQQRPEIQIEYVDVEVPVLVNQALEAVLAQTSLAGSLSQTNLRGTLS